MQKIKLNKMKQSLFNMGLIGEGESPVFSELSGGVASDIWRVETDKQTLCLKSALSQLKVEQDWQVSTDRNQFEVLWFETVGNFLPEAVPKILGHDSKEGAFAMAYFDSRNYPVWKTQLSRGAVNVGTAKQVASYLGSIHRFSAKAPEMAERFQSQDLFFQIRVEPYFLSTAKVHQLLAPRIESLAETLANNQHALVHGDISPKNILVGKSGPIILDAECAVYGDPAFDVSFFLNHLLLKSIWCKPVIEDLLASFSSAYESYFLHLDWENKSEFEARVCAYLGVLLLARIDGKSPVEYIVDEAEKDFVRQMGFYILNNNISKLDEVRRFWRESFVNQFNSKV